MQDRGNYREFNKFQSYGLICGQRASRSAAAGPATSRINPWPMIPNSTYAPEIASIAKPLPPNRRGRRPCEKHDGGKYDHVEAVEQVELLRGHCPQFRRFCKWAIGGDAVCTLHRILKNNLAGVPLKRYHTTAPKCSCSLRRSTRRARCFCCRTSTRSAFTGPMTSQKPSSSGPMWPTA